MIEALLAVIVADSVAMFLFVMWFLLEEESYEVN